MQGISHRVYILVGTRSICFLNNDDLYRNSRTSIVAHCIIANSFDWSISVGYIGAYCTLIFCSCNINLYNSNLHTLVGAMATSQILDAYLYNILYTCLWFFALGCALSKTTNSCNNWSLLHITSLLIHLIGQ